MIVSRHPVTDLGPAIDRALTGKSILILPQIRTEPIAEVPASSYTDPTDAGRRPPALVLFTSGSTGAPKGVALSAEALLTSAHATERFLAGPGDWYLCLAANHIAGFQVELRAHLAGREPLRAGPGPFTAVGFAEGLEALLDRATEPARTAASARPTYVSLVPTQLHRVLADTRATAAAARLSAILLGGASISPALIAAADAAGLTVVRTYGMSETAGGCVYDGIPFDGVSVTITESGTIDLHGDVVADGYVEVTSAGAIVPIDIPGLTTVAGVRTMRTSDLGRIDDGRLSVLGRADDVIISGGTNVSPHALETGLLPSWQKQGIAEVLVTSVPDAEWGELLVALVRLETDPDRISAAVRESTHDPAALARELDRLDHGMEGQVLPRLVLVVDELPTRSIGKPDRVAAARAAMERTGRRIAE